MEQLGDYLKKQREIRNIDLSTIANETKIAPNWLKVIEDDKWDLLPGKTFARGYARAYAMALGLDVEEVMSRYDNMYNGVEVVEVGENIVKLAVKRGRGFKRFIPIIIILALAAAAVVTWILW